MSSFFGTVCDDFSATVRLYLKLDLGLERETVLHFFDRLRKDYPALSRLRRREDDTLLLEEVPQAGDSRRWIRLNHDALRLGHFAPPNVDEVRKFGRLVMSQAPFHLTMGELDYDYLEVAFCFDLEFDGNHDQLVADTLFADHPISSFLMGDQVRHVLDVQPVWAIALTPNCDTQARIEVKSHSHTYEVRTGEYESQPVSVYVTVRRYWGHAPAGELAQELDNLFDRAEQLAAEKAVPLVVQPLAHAIASRS
jgi:hypothetical protein